MNTQTVHFIIYIGLGIAAGSALPNRKDYNIPRDIGFYLWDWVYATVKIVTFNLMKEASKKGIDVTIPPQNAPQPELPKENP